MPQERREKKPELVSIGAKVRRDVFEIVDSAATIRGWPRSRVVEEGALLRAKQIMDDAIKSMATIRKSRRRAVARTGGLARHGKKFHT